MGAKQEGRVHLSHLRSVWQRVTGAAPLAPRREKPPSTIGSASLESGPQNHKRALLKFVQEQRALF